MWGSEAAASAVFSLLRRHRGVVRWLDSSSYSCSNSSKAGERARAFHSSSSSQLPPLPGGGPGLTDFLPPKKRPMPPPPPRQAIPGVAHIVAVSSGKGGVGKSTVAGKRGGWWRSRSREFPPPPIFSPQPPPPLSLKKKNRSQPRRRPRALGPPRLHSRRGRPRALGPAPPGPGRQEGRGGPREREAHLG